MVLFDRFLRVFMEERGYSRHATSNDNKMIVAASKSRPINRCECERKKGETYITQKYIPAGSSTQFLWLDTIVHQIIVVPHGNSQVGSRICESDHISTALTTLATIALKPSISIAAPAGPSRLTANKDQARMLARASFSASSGGSRW